MLPPESWKKGMTVKDAKGRLGVLKRRHPDGHAWYVDYGPEFAAGAWHTDEEIASGKLAGVLSYSDLGRAPREGERAVTLGIWGGEEGHDGVVVTFSGRTDDHLQDERLYHANADDGMNFLGEPKAFAPLSAEEEQDGEPCELTHLPEKPCRKCGKRSEVWRAGEPDNQEPPAPPAPSECARVAAVRREWEREHLAALNSVLNPVTEHNVQHYMESVAAFVAAWRPRLSEFEPCGDCEECGEQAKPPLEPRRIGDSEKAWLAKMGIRSANRRRDANLSPLAAALRAAGYGGIAGGRAR
jgi:hypothetical protein